MSALITRVVVVILAAVLAGSACSVEGVNIPAPTGPSELGLSLELTVSKDIISQDGVSTSRLDIFARGPNSLPQGGVALRVDMLVPSDDGLVAADYGTLSDRWPTTAGNGRASVVYQAPPQPPPTVTSDTTVMLRVTPIGANYSNSVPRVIEVKLVRPGTIRPPSRIVPKFTFSPTSPREHDDIYFDASSTQDPDGVVASYSWTFGDGNSGSGRQTTHSYEFGATYGVVLTVTDIYGTSISAPLVNVTVGTSALPVAKFTVSPTTVTINKTVGFNAVGSTAATGRRIVGYNWDLGDGTFVEGVAITHVYKLAGTYTVTLVVTDDGGRKGVVSQTVTVGIGPGAEPDASPAMPPDGPDLDNLVILPIKP